MVLIVVFTVFLAASVYHILIGRKHQWTIVQTYTNTCHGITKTITERHRRFGLGQNYQVIIKEVEGDVVLGEACDNWYGRDFADQQYIREVRTLHNCAKRETLQRS